MKKINIQSTIYKTKLSYRKCVGIVLLNKKNKIFLAKRINSFIRAWQMPQGGANTNELIINTAIRELEEETMAAEIKIIGELNECLLCIFPKSLKIFFSKKQYKGQCQKWFILRFLGKNKDINLQKTSNQEFCNWYWASIKELSKNLIQFKDKTYKILIQKLLLNII